MATTPGITVPVTAELTTAAADAVHALADLARLATTPTEIHDGIWASVGPDGVVRCLDLRRQIEEDREHPSRKVGNPKFTDPASFTAYLAKHGLDQTEIFADINRATVTAVINAHENDEYAGWGDHTATLALTLTADWGRWIKHDRSWLSQEDFAEFIEQHLPCCVTPDGATMLELAQTIKGTKSVKFEQSKRLKSGETKLEWREDIEAKAGARGSIDIPDEITLALAPYEGGAPYKVAARLRYRISDGGLSLSYVLIRPRDVLLDAFGGVVADLKAATGRDIWHGTP